MFNSVGLFVVIIDVFLFIVIRVLYILYVFWYFFSISEMVFLGLFCFIVCKVFRFVYEWIFLRLKLKVWLICDIVSKEVVWSFLLIWLIMVFCDLKYVSVLNIINGVSVIISIIVNSLFWMVGVN